MITYEEKAFERILFSGLCDTAIPISVRVGKSGVDICALPSVRDIACEFEKKFGDKPFSKEAREYLQASLRPFMYEHNFIDNRASMKVSDVYAFYEGDLPDSPNACIITNDDLVKLANRTSAPLCDLLEFRHTVAAVIEGEDIVSVAYTDVVPKAGHAVEIGVETAKDYRGRGLAKRACGALIYKLAKIGCVPIYECLRTNRASVRLARSLGFVREESELNYVFRRR